MGSEARITDLIYHGLAGITCVVVAVVVTGCASYQQGDIISESDLHRIGPTCLTPEEIGARQDQLRSIRARVQRDGPLKLLPLIDQLNCVLAQAGTHVRLVAYWEPPVKRDNWQVSYSLVDLATKARGVSYFNGSTADAILHEINEGNMYDCIRKLQHSYMLQALHYRNYIVLTPSIATTRCAPY
jgi:hypothetical protein